MLVGIAGDSATGKSTFAELFQSKYEALIVECDCFHKWERGDSNWKVYTHLDPFANKMDEQLTVIEALNAQNSTKIRPYLHGKGTFARPTTITPKDLNIMCGLLTFYDTVHASHYDLKIYIEVEENLKTFMKVKRDVHHRGYTIEQVLSIIRRRERDFFRYVDFQRNMADVIIRYSTKSSTTLDKVYTRDYFPEIDAEVIVNGVVTKGDAIEVCEKILGEKMKRKQLKDEYSALCQQLGGYVELFQGNGGNISVKDSDAMIIKKSGYRVSDWKNGSCWCDPRAYVQALQANEEVPMSSEPSLEAWFHSFTKKYTVHFHPIHFNTHLCTREMPDMEGALLIGYKSPGFHVASEIFSKYRDHSVIFLQNHGVICTSDSLEEVYTLVANVMDYHTESAIVGACIRARIPDTMFYPTNYVIDPYIRPYTPDIATILGSKITTHVNVPGLFLCEGRIVIAAKTKEKCRDVEEVLISYIQLINNSNNLTTINNAHDIVSWDREIFRKNQEQ
jgi:uridine kinase